MSSLSELSSLSLSSPLSPLSTTTRAFLFITFDCCVGIIDERSGGRGIVDGRSGDRCACCGRATTVEAVAAQRLWWQRSNGGNGAQRWQRRWRRSDGDDGAATSDGLGGAATA
jgi:hypothetical protein